MKKIVPVGASWEGVDPKDDMRYTITLSRREGRFEIWNWYKHYSDGSCPSDWSDWGPSYENCRKQLYLDGSGVRMKRVK